MSFITKYVYIHKEFYLATGASSAKVSMDSANIHDNTDIRKNYTGDLIDQNLRP